MAAPPATPPRSGREVLGVLGALDQAERRLDDRGRRRSHVHRGVTDRLHEPRVTRRCLLRHVRQPPCQLAERDGPDPLAEPGEPDHVDERHEHVARSRPRRPPPAAPPSPPACAPPRAGASAAGSRVSGPARESSGSPPSRCAAASSCSLIPGSMKRPLGHRANHLRRLRHPAAKRTRHLEQPLVGEAARPQHRSDPRRLQVALPHSSRASGSGTASPAARRDLIRYSSGTPASSATSRGV